jgi:hypothetical protein
MTATAPDSAIFRNIFSGFAGEMVDAVLMREDGA